MFFFAVKARSGKGARDTERRRSGSVQLVTLCAGLVALSPSQAGAGGPGGAFADGAAAGLPPILWKVAINDIDFSVRLTSPTLAHPFGTDDLGQDVFARMLYGGRISLAVGLSAMLMAVLVGVSIGAIAGI